MRLTIREAATVMDVSPRTLRARLARGELPGKKKNGIWTIERRHSARSRPPVPVDRQGGRTSGWAFIDLSQLHVEN